VRLNVKQLIGLQPPYNYGKCNGCQATEDSDCCATVAGQMNCRLIQLLEFVVDHSLHVLVTVQLDDLQSSRLVLLIQMIFAVILFPIVTVRVVSFTCHVQLLPTVGRIIVGREQLIHRVRLLFRSLFQVRIRVRVHFRVRILVHVLVLFLLVFVLVAV
jgi:hypothetical protein